MMMIIVRITMAKRILQNRRRKEIVRIGLKCIMVTSIVKPRFSIPENIGMKGGGRRGDRGPRDRDPEISISLFKNLKRYIFIHQKNDSPRSNRHYNTRHYSYSSLQFFFFFSLYAIVQQQQQRKSVKAEKKSVLCIHVRLLPSDSHYNRRRNGKRNFEKKKTQFKT